MSMLLRSLTQPDDRRSDRLSIDAIATSVLFTPARIPLMDASLVC